MVGRKRGDADNASAFRVPIDRSLTVVGDSRTAPIAIREEGGRPYRSTLALWLNAANGQVWGSDIGQSGERAERAAALARGLLNPGPPPYGERHALPCQLLLFDAALVAPLRRALGDERVAIDVVEPVPAFEAAFKSFFSFLEEQHETTSDLPEDVLALLVQACRRLWEHKPWQYLDDEPPFQIRPHGGFEGCVASVLGAADEVFGVSLFASSADFKRFVTAGKRSRAATLPPGLAAVLGAFGLSGVDDATRTMRVMDALHQRALLISFDPRHDLKRDHVAQVTRQGWPRRAVMVPTFGAMGGRQLPGEPTADEARQAALAIEALVTFCEAHEDALATGDFPVTGTVQVVLDGEVIMVDLSVPPEPARRQRRARAKA